MRPLHLFVEVVFTLRDAVATKTFHIPVQIRRTSTSGVGVAFEKQPVEALRALQKQRMESHKSRIVANLPGNQNQDLRIVCKKLLEDALYRAQDHFSQVIEERLTSEANHATSFGEHSALMDAIPEFKRHQPVIREKFIQITLSAPEKGIIAKTVDDPQELSLVEEQDFEDWLAATAEGNKLVDQLRFQLSIVEPGLQQLATPFFQVPTPCCNGSQPKTRFQKAMARRYNDQSTFLVCFSTQSMRESRSRRKPSLISNGWNPIW